jgi:hypothetical protein
MRDIKRKSKIGEGDVVRVIQIASYCERCPVKNVDYNCAFVRVSSTSGKIYKTHGNTRALN